MLRKEQPNPNPQLSLSFTINFQELALEQELGRGGFGVVYKATYRHNDVAVKQLLSSDISPDSAQEFETEVQFMAQLHSPNIIHFYGYALSPTRCIVMEYMPNGSLYSVLHSNKPLEWPLRLQIAMDTAKGLAFLHHENIFHRDIKSLNVLLGDNYKAKLTDFGLSKVKAETKSHTLATKTNNKDSVGTIQWMAPELFRRNAQFTQKSDVYSLGVTFWELASRKVPFSDALDASLIKDWVKEGERETIPQDCPPTFGTLIQECWEGEPSTRPDTNAIVTQLKQTLETFSPQKTSNAPSPSPSPFPAPSGPQYLDNFVSEGSPKPLVFSSSSKPQPALQIKQASPQVVADFVKLIAEGEQDQAEALLQKDRTLALLSSNVTDLSGRTFKGITGFQYAVWALDWHMWTMILKYLPKDKAAEQIESMDKGSWVSQYHKSGDWLIQNLVDALQKYIDLSKASQRDKTEAQWQNQVGGAQHLLPVHVINEYCHPNRPFEPCPDFTKSELLPRTRKIDEGEWFTASYNGGKLGEKFAFYRGRWPSAGGFGSIGRGDYFDRTACHTLLATRTQQRNQLIAELSSFAQKIIKAPSPNPSPFPAPSGPQYFSNFATESSPKPLVFSPPPKPQPAPQIKQVLPQAVAVFVKLIAEGEQDQAEALLQKDATLALLPSDVTDLSGRTFKGITGFQYAVWALDWHMWTMILNYLTADKAAEQIKAMDKGSWVSQHRKSGDWLIQNLVDALQKYIDLYTQSKYSELESQWQTKIGSAQRLLPVHVINEYCHPNRPFEPCPDFSKSDPLPRTRKIDWGIGVEWFTQDRYNGGKLGEKFAIRRATGFYAARAVDAAARGTSRYMGPAYDRTAVHTLLVVRTQQRNQLVAELSSNKRYGYK